MRPGKDERTRLAALSAPWTLRSRCRGRCGRGSRFGPWRLRSPMATPLLPRFRLLPRAPTLNPPLLILPIPRPRSRSSRGFAGGLLCPRPRILLLLPPLGCPSPLGPLDACGRRPLRPCSLLWWRCRVGFLAGLTRRFRLSVRFRLRARPNQWSAHINMQVILTVGGVRLRPFLH